MAEDERQRIVGRANGGRKAAKARGVRFGRRPKLSAFQRDEVGRRLAAGEPIGDLAKSYKVSRWTITRLTQA